MNLSICIITKNEEKNIEHCLTCLIPYQFEIIVVDTGSTDHTIEIASQYTSNIYHFAWCDDFAAAKNFAISKATNEYVMIIDSDEYLEIIYIEKLYFMIQQHPDMVGRIYRKNTFVRNKLEQETPNGLIVFFQEKNFAMKVEFMNK